MRSTVKWLWVFVMVFPLASTAEVDTRVDIYMTDEAYQAYVNWWEHQTEEPALTRAADRRDDSLKPELEVLVSAGLPKEEVDQTEAGVRVKYFLESVPGWEGKAEPQQVQNMIIGQRFGAFRHDTMTRWRSDELPRFMSELTSLLKEADEISKVLGEAEKQLGESPGDVSKRIKRLEDTGFELELSTTGLQARLDSLRDSMKTQSEQAAKAVEALRPILSEKREVLQDKVAALKRLQESEDAAGVREEIVRLEEEIAKLGQDMQSMGEEPAESFSRLGVLYAEAEADLAENQAKANLLQKSMQNLTDRVATYEAARLEYTRLVDRRQSLEMLVDYLKKSDWPEHDGDGAMESWFPQPEFVYYRD